MNRWHLLALVLLVAVAYAAITVAGGLPFNNELFIKASTISAVVGACVLAFDRWLWRLPILHPWFVAAPNLSGKWDVTGKIAFLRAGASGSYSGEMTIEQTFF